MTEDGGLTIGEVAQATGVPSSTLRYWERVGLLARPQRVSGRRRYTPETIEEVAIIELAKRAGFTLAEVKLLLSGLSETAPPSKIWAELARRKLPEIERKLSETVAVKKMLEAGLDCECVTVQACLGWLPAR